MTSKCHVHPLESLDIYCSDCHHVVCGLCMSTSHYSHVTNDVADEVDIRRCQLDDAMTVIGNKKTEFLAAGERLREWQKLTETGVTDEVHSYIVKSAENLREEIYKQQKTLVRDFDVLLSKRIQDIEDTKRAIEHQMPDLETLSQSCQRCVKETSSVSLLERSEELLLSAKDLQFLRVDVDCLVPSLKRPLPRHEDFLQWTVPQLLQGNEQYDDLCSDDVDDNDDSSEILNSWPGVRDNMARCIDDEQLASSSCESGERLQDTGRKLLEIAGKLEKQLNKEIRRNSKLTKTLRETKALLIAEQERDANAVINDHRKALQQSLAEVDRLLEEQDRQQAEAEIERSHLALLDVSIDIAVVGNSGVGKSSFINSIRRLTADDIGAAEVGVNETTAEITAYTHPDNPRIKFWDLPGVGTNRFPRENYLQLLRIERFDFFVIMSATRFTENDTWLAKEISKRGKRYFFVRTKLALDISNNRRSHPRTHNEAAVLADIMRDIQQHLKDSGTGSNADVFVIDSYAVDKFDFEQLERRLLRDLPELKRTTASRRSCVIS